MRACVHACACVLCMQARMCTEMKHAAWGGSRVSGVAGITVQTLYYKYASQHIDSQQVLRASQTQSPCINAVFVQGGERGGTAPGLGVDAQTLLPGLEHVGANLRARILA